MRNIKTTTRGGLAAQTKNNSKRRILLKLIAPCSVAVLASSACWLLLSSCSKSTTFTSVNDIEKYISKHQKIHEDQKDWSTKDENDKEMLAWLWDRKNFGLQNIINSGLTFAKDNFFGENAQGITDVKITLKTSNKSAELLIKDNYTDDDHNVFSQAQSFDIKNFKNDGFDYKISMALTNYIESVDYHIISWWSYSSSNETLRGDCGNSEVGEDVWMPFYPLTAEYPNIDWPQ